MSTQKAMQFVVVQQAKPNNSTGPVPAAFFNPNGTPYDFDGPGVPVATTTVKGIVNRAAAQSNSTATDVAGLVTDFNALLAKLRTAGLL